MMRWIKKIPLTLMVFLVILSCLWGSETRITTMGYLANYYVSDDYNIWVFPSTLVNYNKMISVESYNDDGALWSGGIHVPVSSSFVLGLYLRNRSQEIRYADTELDSNWYPVHSSFFVRRWTLNSDLNKREAAHQFDIFGGLRLTNADLGFHVSSYSSKMTATYTDPSDSLVKNYEDRLGTRLYELGIGFKVNERSRLDGALFYSTGNFAHIEGSRDTAQYKEPEGYNAYGVVARLLYAFSKNTVIVPFAGYMQCGEGYKWLVKDINKTQGESTYKDKYAQYTLGVAADLIPHEKNLVTLAGGLVYQSYTFEETWITGTPPPAPTYTQQTLPFLSIGLESKITKWLGARFAFYELLNTHKEKIYNPINKSFDEVKLTGNQYNARFGVWFQFGRFQIDTLVDTEKFADFLQNGPYLLSGQPSENGLFTQISVTYNFQ